MKPRETKTLKVRITIFVMFLSTVLALPASARIGGEKLFSPIAQTPETAWVIWETDAPLQRLALNGDTLWVGAYKGGLYQWDLERGWVADYHREDGLLGEDVLSLAADTSGDLWVASLDGGIVQRSGGSFTNRTPSGVAGINPWALASKGAELWLASLGGGVSHYQGNGWDTYTTEDGLPYEDVYAIEVDDSGAPWIGTMGYGIVALQGDTWIPYDPPLTIEDPLEPGQHVSNDAISDIAVDGSGNKWFATDGSGVAVLDSTNTTWTLYDQSNSGLCSNFVHAVYVDPRDNLWFGTLGGGLCRLSADRTTWLTYDSTNTPLPEDDILAVTLDGNGGLWLAAYDTGLAFYGDLPLTPPSFDLDPRGQPEYEPGEVKGYFLWLDPETYHWYLAWSGEGEQHHFEGEILLDAPMTLIETQDLEPEDTAEVSGNALTIQATEGEGQDLVTFGIDRATTELTLRLKIDGAYYPFNIYVGAVGAKPGTTPFKISAPQPEPPVVVAGEDRVLNEGDLVFFSGAFSDPDSPTGHSIIWDLDDSNTVEDGLSPTHTYLDDGEYNVTLTITDVYGEVGDDSLLVTVENVAPETGFFTDPVFPTRGELVTFNAYLYDPGQLDTHTIEWNFGDGTDPLITDELTVTHTYTEAGEYEATLTVTDDDGGVGSETWTILVEEAGTPPTVEVGEDVTLNEGETFLGSGSFEDPDEGTWTATVDYGDGSGVQDLPLNLDKSFELAHTYLNDGAYTVNVTVIDERDLEGTDSLTVTVDNVAPIVDVGEDFTLVEGETLLRLGSFADPGADTWTATVDYGDGSGVQDLPLTVEKTFELNHLYSVVGTHTATVCVLDDDGGEGCVSFQVTVEEAADTAQLPIGWWKLDEGEGSIARDDGRGGHPGTLKGDSAWTEGYLGGAVSFDGRGDYIDVGDFPEYDFQEVLSISAWVKADAPGRLEYPAILGKRHSFALGLFGRTLKPVLVLRIPGAEGVFRRLGMVYCLSQESLEAETWQHVVGTYSREDRTMRVYIDGQEVCAQQVNGGDGLIAAGWGPLEIGRWYPMRSYFKGALDEVRLYGRALSLDEIEVLHQQSTTNAPPAKPANLTAEIISPTEVRLTWKDNTTGESGFLIDRKSSATNGQYVTLAQVGPSVTEYSDTEVEPGTAYFYRVRTFSWDGFSGFSNEASIITPYEEPPTTEPPLGWWKFDDGEGVVAEDSGVGGHDGSLQGDPEWVEGRLGGGLALDGAGDYVTIGHFTDYDLTEALTLSAWVKVDGSGWFIQPVIFSKNQAYALKLLGPTHLPALVIRDPDAKQSDWFGNVTCMGMETVETGVWHHIAGTYSVTDRTLRVYVDGVEVCTKQTTGGDGLISTSSAPLELGSGFQRGISFKGVLDEVRIYDIALSHERIFQQALLPDITLAMEENFMDRLAEEVPTPEQLEPTATPTPTLTETPTSLPTETPSSSTTPTDTLVPSPTETPVPSPVETSTDTPIPTGTATAEGTASEE